MPVTAMTTLQDTVRRYRRKLGRPLELARLMWSTGALDDPAGLLEQLRHHRQIARLHRSLSDQRYATALLLAHRSGLLSALEEGPLTFEQVAQRAGLLPRPAEVLLRVLESERVVERQGNAWGLSPLGQLTLASASPHSIRSMLELLAAQAASFGAIADGLRTGRTPPGLDIFEPASSYGAFLDAVNSYLLLASRDLLSRIELPQPLDRLIVGSMGVSFSAVVLSRCPNARVTYGCLAHLVREIPRLCEQYGVPPERIDARHDHRGDPEADSWGAEPFDLVLLTKKMILEPEQRLGERFARKAYAELRPGGMAIFWECLHTDDRPTPLGRALEAILDLGASPNGLVSTEASMKEMLARIGFGQLSVHPCLGGQTTFITARKL